MQEGKREEEEEAFKRHEKQNWSRSFLEVGEAILAWREGGGGVKLHPATTKSCSIKMEGKYHGYDCLWKAIYILFVTFPFFHTQ